MEARLSPSIRQEAVGSSCSSTNMSPGMIGTKGISQKYSSGMTDEKLRNYRERRMQYFQKKAEEELRKIPYLSDRELMEKLYRKLIDFERYVKIGELMKL